ncbi:hypothetical protein UFOVP116_342 [uncultured Caudovirales phage]|uniref:Uncharacterized protein n=1 Tax=uncultured Caudovirales phage TaxID=2100421 RepID=A0A6J5L8A5_9CAUD|nr:hypothetical protein UFOVP116_342 [uncultured Caudovirales phage]
MKVKENPMQFRTYDTCKKEITQNWRALKYTPHHFLANNNHELCRIAFEQNNRAIYYLPEDVRTDAMFRTLLEVDPRSFSHFPKEKRTREMSEIGTNLDGSLYHYVPNTVRTLSMKLNADRIRSLSESIFQLVSEKE